VSISFSLSLSHFSSLVPSRSLSLSLSLSLFFSLCSAAFIVTGTCARETGRPTLWLPLFAKGRSIPSPFLHLRPLLSSPLCSLHLPVTLPYRLIRSGEGVALDTQPEEDVWEIRRAIRCRYKEGSIGRLTWLKDANEVDDFRGYYEETLTLR